MHLTSQQAAAFAAAAPLSEAAAAAIAAAGTGAAIEQQQRIETSTNSAAAAAAAAAAAVARAERRQQQQLKRRAAAAATLKLLFLHAVWAYIILLGRKRTAKLGIIGNDKLSPCGYCVEEGLRNTGAAAAAPKARSWDRVPQQLQAVCSVR
ncbi:hypothetical protein Emag_000373 [Eimeria magna]